MLHTRGLIFRARKLTAFFLAVLLVTALAGAAPKFVEPELEIKRFKVPEGFKPELWAEEPQLANPVAMCIDEQGRVYVTETYRLIDGGVYDIRNHMDLYNEDLACRTI